MRTQACPGFKNEDDSQGRIQKFSKWGLTWGLGSEVSSVVQGQSPVRGRGAKHSV